MKLRYFVKQILPPFFLDLLKKARGRRGTYFWGNFSSWDEALIKSSGYDSDAILNKVVDANLKIKHKEAVFERDSVIFDEIQFSFPVLAGLLRVAAGTGNKLAVLDFGGSFGSSYHQCRTFLACLNKLHWGIVEQEKFVTVGRELFETEELKFYYNIDEYLQFCSPDVVLLSSVVQYLKEPHAFLDKLVDYEFSNIIFDRVSFIDLPSDHLTIQEVDPSIYKANYPVWFFNYEQFLSHFEHHYEVIAKFDGFESWKVNGLVAQNRGFILKRYP